MAGGRSTAGNSTSDTCTANPAARPASDFAYDVRALVARQSLPGYVLGIERMPDDNTELLTPVPHAARG